MKVILIPGWATGEGVWRRVTPMLNHFSVLPWPLALEGHFHPSEPCILAGWSLGGQLAVKLSSRPEVKGLVLISSMLSLSAADPRRGVNPSKEPFIRKMMARSRRGYLRSFFQECGADSSTIETLMEDSSVFSDEELLAGLCHMFHESPSPRSELPATLIHGTDDRIVPPGSMDFTASVLSGSVKRITVENGDHILPLSAAETVGRVVKHCARNASS